MTFAPQQDWSYVEALTRDGDATHLREMITAERFAVYADMYNTLWAARRKAPGDWQRLEDWRWQEKLALRLRMVEAFAKLDQSRRG